MFPVWTFLYQHIKWKSLLINMKTYKMENFKKLAKIKDSVIDLINSQILDSDNYECMLTSLELELKSIIWEETNSPSLFGFIETCMEETRITISEAHRKLSKWKQNLEIHNEFKERSKSLGYIPKLVKLNLDYGETKNFNYSVFNPYDVLEFWDTCVFIDKTGKVISLHATDEADEYLLPEEAIDVLKIFNIVNKTKLHVLYGNSIIGIYYGGISYLFKSIGKTIALTDLEVQASRIGIESSHLETFTPDELLGYLENNPYIDLEYIAKSIGLKRPDLLEFLVTVMNVPVTSKLIDELLDQIELSLGSNAMQDYPYIPRCIDWIIANKFVFNFHERVKSILSRLENINLP